MFAVIDTVTKNVLGEFDRIDDAERFYAELVGADSRAADVVAIVAASDAEPAGDAVRLSVAAARPAP
jgi:hypothetical protein